MELLQAVLPVIVMLGIGVLCRARKIISAEGIDGLQTLIMDFCLPVSLFSNFYCAPLAADTLLYPAIMFLMVTLGIFGGRLLRRIFRQQDPYLPFMATGYEAGLIGYALMGILVGSDITTFAMLDLGNGLAIFTSWLAIFKASEGEKQTAGQAFKSIITAPSLVGILLGFLLGITGLGKMINGTAAGPVIDGLCTFISKPTSAVILVVIGYHMNLKGINWRAISITILIRVMMQVILVGAMMGIFTLIGGIFASSATRLALLMFLILPPAYVLPLYIKKPESQEFYASAVSAYTMLTMIGFLVMAAVILL